MDGFEQTDSEPISSSALIPLPSLFYDYIKLI